MVRYQQDMAVSALLVNMTFRCIVPYGILICLVDICWLILRRSLHLSVAVPCGIAGIMASTAINLCPWHPRVSTLA